MPNPLTRKLELFGSLPDADKRLLDEVVRNSQRFMARTSIIQEGDEPKFVHLVVSGLACRYKMLPNGRKHIFAYLVPGDICDLHVFVLREMDHGIEALSACDIVKIPRTRVSEMLQRPNLARGLWWVTLVDEATLREWLVNLGQRDAVHRIAHLICELHLRMRSVGFADDKAFSLPITQTELAETMGLSTVHVNRALQSLRRANLIGFRSGLLTIPDLDRLREVSDFNPNYLHLSGGKRDNADPVAAQSTDVDSQPTTRTPILDEETLRRIAVALGQSVTKFYSPTADLPLDPPTREQFEASLQELLHLTPSTSRSDLQARVQALMGHLTPERQAV